MWPCPAPPGTLPSNDSHPGGVKGGACFYVPGMNAGEYLQSIGWEFEVENHRRTFSQAFHYYVDKKRSGVPIEVLNAPVGSVNPLDPIRGKVTHLYSWLQAINFGHAPTPDHM